MSLEKYYPQGDYDEGSQFSLNEAEWHSYLSAVDAEAGKFLRLFILIRHVSNHLDIIFSKMKWNKVFVCKRTNNYDEDIDVTTFHKNPINVASKALFFFAEKIWGMLLKSCDKVLAEDCWKFSTSMNLIHVEMISGVASMDTCEYLLALCHFKNAVAGVQRILSILPSFCKFDEDFPGFNKDISIVLFDLRELAWCGIAMCKSANVGQEDD